MNRKDDHQSNNSSEQPSKESLEQSNEQLSIESTKEPKSNEESRKESSGDAIKKVKKTAISKLKENCRWFGSVVVTLGVFGLILGLGYIFYGNYKIKKGKVLFIEPSPFANDFVQISNPQFYMQLFFKPHFGT